MDEAQLRGRFCAALNQLWTRGMIVGRDGMLCCEVHRRRYLATPPGARRVDLTPNDLICVDIGGENVQAGEGIEPEAWQPHRDAYQSHMDPSDISLGASAILEPVHVMALALKTGGDALDLNGESIRLINAQDTGAMRSVIADTPLALIRGRGLFIAAEGLDELLNRIERLEHAAAIQLAGC